MFGAEDVIKESSEPASGSSLEQSNLKSEENSLTMPSSSLEDHYKKCLSENEELKFIIDQQKKKIAELIDANNLQKAEMIQEITEESNKSLHENVKERIKNRMQSKLSISSCESFDFTSNPYLGFVYEKTRGKSSFSNLPQFNIDELEAKMENDQDTIVGLREENIRLNYENAELRENMQELIKVLEGYRELHGSNPMTIHETINQKQVPGYEILANMEMTKEEIRLAKNRNMDLEKILEELKKDQMKYDEYYQNTFFGVVPYYKKLYECYLAKLNFLKDKENRLLRIYKQLKDELDNDSVSERNSFYILVCFLLLIIFFLFMASIYYPKLFKLQ